MRQLSIDNDFRAKLFLLYNDIILVDNELRWLICALNKGSFNFVLNANIKLHFYLIDNTEVSPVLHVLKILLNDKKM